MSLLKNTSYNFFGLIIPLLVSLITVPIYIDLIGEVRYGILAIAWLLLGYFGLFDLGLSRATAQSIAQFDGKPPKQAEVFWTALSLNVAMGVLGGLVVWPVAVLFFEQYFVVDEVYRSEILDAIPWLIMAVPLATLSGVLVGALQGRERFLELNTISSVGTILFQVLPLVAAGLWSSNLSLLLPVAIFARVITFIALGIACRLHVTRNHSVTFDLRQAKRLLRFGGWVTITSFVGPMMVIMDRFIIGALSGAKTVTYYTVPFQLAERTTVIANALTTALFPRFAIEGEEKDIFLAKNSLCILLLLITPPIIVFILLMGPILSWWINDEFSKAAALPGQIILLGFWANSLARIPYAQLQARGRPDVVAKCHLAELLPYLTLLYICLDYWGLPGAALAFSVRAAIDFILLATFSKLFNEVKFHIIIPFILLVLAFIVAASAELGEGVWGFMCMTLLAATVAWGVKSVPLEIMRSFLARLKIFVASKR
ncbi:flippase [Stutzerimonas nitrititolerans]|uniref:flippase n=1 Tax=Stutzerimonas nitrititolerans TaxID=2482751 RepID=UPI00289B78E3|nr:flippase [Stutzerimonas nitrititolerans]